MAKHVAQQKNQDFKLPSFKLPTLKTLAAETDVVQGIRNRRTSNAVFSLSAILPLLAAWAILAVAVFTDSQGLVRLALLLTPSLIAAWPAFMRILVAALHKKLRERDTLLVLAVIGAFATGQYAAGALAAVLYRTGELLEGLAVYTGKDALTKLVDCLPTKADVEVADGVNRLSPNDIAVGDILSIMPSESIPVDSEVLEGSTTLDASLLTGREEPVQAAPGDTVLSGCVNRGETIRIRAMRTAEDSAAAKLVEIVESASSNRAEREKSVSRFTGASSFIIFLLALFVGVVIPLFKGDWARYLREGISLLVLALPTGMLVSMPLAYLGGVLKCAYKGIFVKGTHFIEAMAHAQTMVFEKSGTITERDCSIAEVFPRGVSEEELLKLAALAEARSSHPIAQALRVKCGPAPEAGLPTEVTETECRGISAQVAGKTVLVGNAQFMLANNITCELPGRKGTPVHVAADGRYLGYFYADQQIKDNAFDSLEAIRSSGVKQLVMLTGELYPAARPVASSLGFDMVKSDLSKDGKLQALEYLLASRSGRETLLFVGDGDRNGELFRRADVGILLGALDAPQALDEADVVVLSGDIAALAQALDISRRADLMAGLNVLVTLICRAVGVVFCLLGLMPLWLAVLVESAAMLFTLFNTLRVYIGIDIKRRRGRR